MVCLFVQIMLSNINCQYHLPIVPYISYLDFFLKQVLNKYPPDITFVHFCKSRVGPQKPNVCDVRLFCCWVVVPLPLAEQKHLRILTVGSHGVTTIFHKGPVNMDNNKMWRMWFMSKSLCIILCLNTHEHTQVCASAVSSVSHSCLFAAVGVCRAVFVLMVGRGQVSISVVLKCQRVQFLVNKCICTAYKFDRDFYLECQFKLLYTLYQSTHALGLNPWPLHYQESFYVKTDLVFFHFHWFERL